MRIAIDATVVGAMRKGAGLVLDELIVSSAADSLVASALLFVENSFGAEARRLWPGHEMADERINSSFVWEALGLPRALRRREIDLALTVRDRTIAPAGIRTVVWLFEVPDHRTRLMLAGDAPLSRKLAARVFMRRFASVAPRVTHFITSSTFTRDDLIQIYGIPPERITVIHPGVSDLYLRHTTGPTASDRHPVCDNPFVLHFATGDARDNSEFAIRCFAAARKRVGDLHLVLAGVPESLEPKVAAIAHELQIEKEIHVLGYVPKGEMPALYASALAYLDPTLFEGFGRQLIESMACGTPVVSTEGSSVSEIMSDAGLLLELNDFGAFVDALVLAITDRQVRDRCRTRGIERAQFFSWKSAASAVDKLLRGLE